MAQGRRLREKRREAEKTEGRNHEGETVLRWLPETVLKRQREGYGTVVFFRKTEGLE